MVSAVGGHHSPVYWGLVIPLNCYVVFSIHSPGSASVATCLCDVCNFFVYSFCTALSRGDREYDAAYFSYYLFALLLLFLCLK